MTEQEIDKLVSEAVAAMNLANIKPEALKRALKDQVDLLLFDGISPEQIRAKLKEIAEHWQ